MANVLRRVIDPGVAYNVGFPTLKPFFENKSAVAPAWAKEAQRIVDGANLLITAPIKCWKPMHIVLVGLQTKGCDVQAALSDESDLDIRAVIDKHTCVGFGN